MNGPARGKQRNVTPRTLRRLGRLALFTGAAFLGGAAATAVSQGVAPASATTEAASPYAFLGQMSRVLVLIENEYVEPVDRSRLLEGSIKGMVAELDPHSAYLPAQDYTVFQSDTEGKFGGIGVEVDFGDKTVTVIAPIEGSPAERAGIHPGDAIVAIDGLPVREKTPAELVKQMRGEPGSRVTLTVKRPKAAKLLYFKLKREIIAVSSVAGKLLDGRVAYLRIKQFQSGTHTELMQQIAKLRNAAPGGELKGVLLDMRNNPGGLVDEASAVADVFLPGGVIYSTRARGKTVSEVRAQPGGALVGEPLVVLVNEYSASASELVAGALQDHKRGTVVGAKTFGKGSVQSILDLPGGAGLRLTSRRYYTPKGGAIQARGITPDVQVAASVLPDRSFGVLRESDLDNHLPAEGPPGSSPIPKAKPAGGEGGGVSATHLGVARVIPKNPVGSADFALSMAYQILQGVIAR